ncbi:MAG: alpha/beta hydrolase [Clostridia bacterium]|nr:alpha/beta hydrolase [Clostridia bacterium]
MITMNHKLRDVRADSEANLWLESYSSVPEINRILRLMEPFKFSTLAKIIPGNFIKDLVGFFNGEDDAVPVTDPRSILLWEEKDIPLYDGKRKPYIVPFLLENKKAPVVVIAPGGAYLHVCMKHEGVDIAERFNQLGFHAVIVCYRTSPSRYPCPQLDFIRAIQTVRNNAEKWEIIENQVIAMGFSAGGHLVTSINGVYDELRDMTGDLAHLDGKPDAVIGGYPMTNLKCKDFGITSDKIFLGKNYSEELSDKLSVHNLINENYPPMFLFSMKYDPIVPPETNCLAVEKVMNEKNVPNEVHVYRGNVHGFALADGLEAGQWVNQSIEFLKKNNVL